MKRTTLILTLGLVAALGVILGLVFHAGEEWHRDRKEYQEYKAIPGRFPLAQFTNGTCGEDEFSLNQQALAVHLATLGEDLDLDADQADLIGQLILSRAQVGCDFRLHRAQIRETARNKPLADPKTARPFINSLLDFRQSVTQEALRETRIQRQLLNSLTDEQLEDIDGWTLPRLVPGLSLREFIGPASPRRGWKEPHHLSNERHYR